MYMYSEITTPHQYSNAGAWTDDEAYKLYREKLSRLRDLYIGQLGHLKHVLQEKRREFLLQWHNEGGSRPQGVNFMIDCILVWICTGYCGHFLYTLYISVWF